jgi:hypothetical protein
MIQPWVIKRAEEEKDKNKFEPEQLRLPLFGPEENLIAESQETEKPRVVVTISIVDSDEEE